MTRSFSLTKQNLTSEQLLNLMRLSLSVVDLERHDLLNLVRNIENSAHILTDVKDPTSLDEHVERMNFVAEILKETAERTFATLKTLFDPYNHVDLDALFVSSPQKIIDSIKAIRKHPKIAVTQDSSPSLQLAFPGNILYGILSELISNAGGQVKDKRRVLIRWRMHGEKFQCEVHDNGPGLIHGTHRKFVPLDALPQKRQVTRHSREKTGLQIVNRILNNSEGILLFAKSKKLGGALVYFEIPVMSHSE